MRLLRYLGISALVGLFLLAPFAGGAVNRVEASNPRNSYRPYSYRYYSAKRNAGSRQCYWYYTNGSYVYVCH